MSGDIGGKNYFEIFSLPETFRLDEDALKREYQQLQSRHHPDKFAGAGDRERRLAQQTTSILNDAYETLRSPLRRAAYLLSQRGVDPEEHNQAHLGEAFLFEQMELRERLESAAAKQDMDALDELKDSVETRIAKETAVFAEHYGEGRYADAKPVYNRLQFLHKLRSEIDQAEERLLDY